MKLSKITENLKSTATPIRDIANVLGSIINICYRDDRFKDSLPSKLFKSFLNKALPNNWQSIKNDFIEGMVELLGGNQEYKAEFNDLLSKIADLSKIPDAIVVSSLIDVDPNYLNLTPLKSISMNRNHRDKMKLALQPAGVVSFGANIGEIDLPDLKKVVKGLGEVGNFIQKDVSKMFSGPIKKKF